MFKNIKGLMIDTWIMFKRCILISFRNPEGLFLAIVTPVFMMLLFGAIFGNIVDIGDFNYIDFIVPGIILQCVGQGSQNTAINLCNDMTKGIINRFRSMPMSRSAVLLGHGLASIVKNTITTAATIGAALAIGFRPQASFSQWLVIAGILLLFITAITWIAILVGLKAKTVESTSGFMFPLFILPYISSGFAPAETIHGALRWFATHQPMTHIIDGLRGQMLNMPNYDAKLLAALWCAVIIALALFASVRVYQRKTA